MPTLLFRDIETRSTVRLDRCGAWRYAADPTTEVLCIGYAVDDGPIHIWTPDQAIPEEFLTAARDPDWRIVAHNDQFEAAIEQLLLHRRHAWPLVPIKQHRCTMALALAAALPAALEKAATALGLPFQKDRDGHRLMLQMSRPRRSRKGENPDQLYWIDGPEQRQRLHEYCIRDVELERALFHRLPPLSETEQALWALDQIINQRGFHVDRVLALAARELARHEQEAINAEIAAVTNGEITTANQVARIVAFVHEHGRTLQSLGKRSVSALLAHGPEPDIRRLLELRRDGSRASTRKLDTLLAGLDVDNRLRGTLRYHAASTGRWSGARFQPQNLKRPETKDLAAAVDAVLTGNRERVLELGAPLTVVGDISRALICAKPGHTLIGADFSAIEARVLAWIAGEEWKIENFTKYDETGDPALEPYCVTASKILRRPITPEDEAGRAVGKIAELAGGYGGSVGAWRRFAPEDKRPDQEIRNDITAWRDAHPATRKFWRELERAAKRALFTRRRIIVGNSLAFEPVNRTLYLRLPSGRRLAYPEARLGPGKFENTPQIIFKDNASGGWTDTRAWYGSLAENVVQAISRDLLAAAMLRLEAAGCFLVLHVHDELVAEAPEGRGSTDQFVAIMTMLPDWAQGLPIAAKAWTGPRYVKTKTAPAANAVNGKAHNIITATPAITLPQEPEDEEADEDRIADIPLADLIGEPLTNGKIPCPFHDDHTPSLVVYPDHFHCYGCGAHGDHIDWLMMVEGMHRDQALQFLASWDGPPVDRTINDRTARSAFALELWKEGRSIAGTLAAKYLGETRGIDLAALPADVEEVLRFHPRCPFGAGTRHPCLLALLRDIKTDAPAGIHRVALTPEGKKIDRRMLGRAGAVKLWPAGSQLVIGEGIETVLAAATRIPYRGEPLRPAWSAVSAGPLGDLPVLPGVERLILLVDHDDAGHSAAARCAERWTRAGRTVIRLTPKRAGADFNDLVMRK
jgi:DNA polymerase